MQYAIKIEKYFNGDKMLFLIPLYQRKYAWQEKHCKRLFSDLEKIDKTKPKSHFFGTIVSIRANDIDDDLMIIDGQQRITTISLLVLAALDAIKAGEMECDVDQKYLDKRHERYLEACERSGDRQIKLRPIEQDREVYDKLYSGDIDLDNEKYINNGLVANYKLFRDLIKSSKLTFGKLIEAIETLTVIDIRLERDDNPQLIFESLNSCGKDLEEADKVRNYLLMNLSNDKQDEYYQKYWCKIEQYTDNTPTMFIRDYLTLKRRIIGSITDLYFDFKDFDEKNGMSRKDLLEDMFVFASYYYQASKGKTAYPSVNKKFKQLANIGSSVCMPFYMSFLDYAQRNQLGEDVIYETLDVVENYWARRIVSGYPSNAMTKIFALLHSDVLRIIEQHKKREVELTASYSELVKFVLLGKQGVAKFPTDSIVREQFPMRQVYRIPLDYRCFLFERLERLDSKEGDDNVAEKIRKGQYTIEHIMPQTLNSHWKEELGDRCEEIHERYLHTMGNLTITSYNSNYGNHPFVEKKEGYIDKNGKKVYGYKDTPFRLNNHLKSVTQWTEQEIIIRQQHLLNDFLYLWPMIMTSYVPLDKSSVSISFADDEDLTGRKLMSFTYRGINYEMDNWKGMLVKLCKLVYDENPTTVAMLANNEEWFHRIPSDKMSKITDDCFVWSSASVKTIMSIIRFLFIKCDISDSELQFSIQPPKENETTDSTTDDSDEDIIMTESVSNEGNEDL